MKPQPITLFLPIGYSLQGHSSNINGNTIDRVKAISDLVGISSEIAKEGGYVATLGSNLSYYSSWTTGNQYVKVFGIAKGLGFVCFWTGAIIDVNMYLQGDQSLAKTLANIGVSGYSIYLGGIPGIIIGLVYFGVDKTIGWENVMVPAENHPGIFYGEIPGIPQIR